MTAEEENKKLWDLLHKTLNELKLSANSNHGMSVEEIHAWLEEQVIDVANPHRKLFAIIDDINYIYYRKKNWSWETKFDFIFEYAPTIREILLDLGLRLEYADPDTSYEADVTAYVNALNELRESIAR